MTEYADGDSMLAVIDMQRVFAAPDSPWATPRYAQAAARVLRLLPAFDNDRVVFTRFIAPAEPIGAWRAYYDQWPFALQPPQSRIWELTDEFAHEDAHLIDAPTFGKWTPELAERVGPGGRLVLAGVSTDCCVLSTALAAQGVETVVRALAVREVHDAGLARRLEVETRSSYSSSGPASWPRAPRSSRTSAATCRRWRRFEG